MSHLSQKLQPPTPSIGPHWFLLVPLNQWLGVTGKLVNSRFLGCSLGDSNKEIQCSGCCIVNKYPRLLGAGGPLSMPSASPPCPFAPSNHPVSSRRGLSFYPPPPCSFLSPPQPKMISLYSFVIPHWFSSIISYPFMSSCFASPWKQGPWLIHSVLKYLLTRVCTAQLPAQRVYFRFPRHGT